MAVPLVFRGEVIGVLNAEHRDVGRFGETDLLHATIFADQTATAIGNDQEGDYVLVADTGDVVARRSVEKGPVTTNGCAIRSGLSAQDRVIVNGIARARPGDKVTPVTEPARQPAPAGSSR